MKITKLIIIVFLFVGYFSSTANAACGFNQKNYACCRKPVAFPGAPYTKVGGGCGYTRAGAVTSCQLIPGDGIKTEWRKSGCDHLNPTPPESGNPNTNCQNAQNIVVKVANANITFGLGKVWTTCTGYKTIFQDDGNFVVYNPSGRAVFNTGTQNKGAKVLAMQTDGNLVIYADGGQALWHSHTNGNPGAFLAIQQDGNVVIYDRNSSPLFSTGTNGS